MQTGERKLLKSCVIQHASMLQFQPPSRAAYGSSQHIAQRSIAVSSVWEKRLSSSGLASEYASKIVNYSSSSMCSARHSHSPLAISNTTASCLSWKPYTFFDARCVGLSTADTSPLLEMNTTHTATACRYHVAKTPAFLLVTWLSVAGTFVFLPIAAGRFTCQIGYLLEFTMKSEILLFENSYAGTFTLAMPVDLASSTTTPMRNRCSVLASTDRIIRTNRSTVWKQHKRGRINLCAGTTTSTSTAG